MCWCRAAIRCRSPAGGKSNEAHDSNLVHPRLCCAVRAIRAARGRRWRRGSHGAERSYGSKRRIWSQRSKRSVWADGREWLCWHDRIDRSKRSSGPTGANGSAGTTGSTGPSGPSGPSGGGSTQTLLAVVANTGNGTISATNLQRTTLTNTGASGTIALTLGSGTCTVGQTFTTYVTAAQTIKLVPFTGDQIMTLTAAANQSITSDAVVGSFVSLSCFAAGQWFLTGLNGSWVNTF